MENMPRSLFLTSVRSGSLLPIISRFEIISICRYLTEVHVETVPKFNASADRSATRKDALLARLDLSGVGG